MDRIYLGLKAGLVRDIFKSPTAPTEQTHGDRFLAVIGPFRTMRGAIFMRDHGRSNPHCQCVRDAERLGKKYQTPTGART
jgi:hypothetical protein